MNEKYFVVSNDDSPNQIFFDKEQAFAQGYLYIDSFNEEGERVCAYKFERRPNEYTTDF